MTPGRPVLSVVVPVRDERGRIGELIRGLRRLLGPSAELIVVDDGSTDGSGPIAGQAGAQVITHPYSLGNGASVKRGIGAARGERILLMDGDGQHDPADIPALLGAADRYDLVVGARRWGGQANLLRAVANGIFNRLASYVTGRRVQDLTSGFRVFRRKEVLPFLSILPNRFSYPTTLTLAFLHSGRSVGYVPVTVRPRLGKSKLNPAADGVRFLLIILKIATLYAPLKVFFPASFLFLLLGASHYARTFAAAHRFTNMSALLIGTGILLFLLGLLAEGVADLRYQRNPHDPSDPRDQSPVH